MRKERNGWAAILAALLFFSLYGYSAAAPLAAKPDFSAELIAGGIDESDPTQAWLGLHIKLGQGWKTYWRAPGDAGLPPAFDWTGSRNLADVEVEWPAPHRISVLGIDTVGYSGEVLLPIKIRLRDPQAEADIVLRLTLYVCSTICTRNDLQFTTTLAPGTRLTAPMTRITQRRNKVPRAHSPALSITAIKFVNAPSAHLQITASAMPPLQAPDVFIDGDDAIIAGRPQWTATTGHKSILSVPLEGVKGAALETPLRITLVDGERAVEALYTPETESSGASVPAQQQSSAAGQAMPTAWMMILIALAGGFVLNFMPCVLPVLALKLFALTGHGGSANGALRARLAASAFGIIASFLVLAAGLATLKAAGAQVGWGIQFQQPLFLIGMTVILVLFAANLFGLYEFSLPTWVSASLGSRTGGESLAAHFFNGFVMTLLATPCSAPFVGTAVGFALSQGGARIFQIFGALGMGMAAPHLVLALVPKTARIFPRPGPWMVGMRRITALALLATAGWLLTVLAAISGIVVAVSVAALLGVLIAIFALYRLGIRRAASTWLIVAFAGGAAATAERALVRWESAARSAAWESFTPQKLQELVTSGRTVLVEVTAAWCITCKVNEAVLTTSERIQARLATDVVALRADWTKPDKDITDYLQSFGRYGLPFNAVYGPGVPHGLVLPELLTEEAVLAALRTASGQIGSH